MLETKDLLLKQGSADDWQELYKNLWSRSDVFRYMFAKPSPTEAHAMRKTAAYAEMHKQVKTEFFVYDKASKQAIGIAGLKEIKPSVYTVTDIALCPDLHGRGYGKQILNAFISLAFDELGATELHYDCFRQNEASKRLALSCGFAYTHSEKSELMKDGEAIILDDYEVKKMNKDMCVACDGGILNIRVGAIIMKDGKLLMAGSERAGYLYSVGGRIKFGETAEEAVVREVLEETGVHMEIDHLGFVHENYFRGDVPSNLGKLVYEISFFFYMKVPDDFAPVSDRFMEDSGEEFLRWVFLDEDTKMYPEFFKTELRRPTSTVKHFVTDER